MRIKELRKRTGYTQKQFGALFGIPMRTIQDWELECRTPPEYVINMIEEILYSRKILEKTEQGDDKYVSYHLQGSRQK